MRAHNKPYDSRAEELLVRGVEEEVVVVRAYSLDGFGSSDLWDAK